MSTAWVHFCFESYYFSLSFRSTGKPLVGRPQQVGDEEVGGEAGRPDDELRLVPRSHGSQVSHPIWLWRSPSHTHSSHTHLHMHIWNTHMRYISHTHTSFLTPVDFLLFVIIFCQPEDCQVRSDSFRQPQSIIDQVFFWSFKLELMRGRRSGVV